MRFCPTHRDGTVTAGSLASYQVAVGLSGAGQRVDGVFGPIVKVAVRGWARDLGAGDHSGDYLAVVGMVFTMWRLTVITIPSFLPV